MKQLCSTTLAVAAAVLAAACSITALPGPKYVPESTAVAGPEPRIPNEWFGCWKGTVDSFDTVTPLSPSVSANSIKTLSTTYTLCFTKRPDGSGQLELADVEIGGHKGTVTHFDNRFTSLGPTPDRASMRNHAIVESVLYVLWIFPIHVTQEIYADEDLQFVPPNVVSVRGKQLVVMGGNMIASMTFHANFNREQIVQAMNGSS
jgi:hypothetical protein